MPGLLQKRSNNQSSPSSSSSSTSPRDCNGIWSQSRKDLTFANLQKFWSELPFSARRQLLRIDKQALFEQVRKNLYCSRCNGLLLEGYSQIVVYGKSLQQKGSSDHNVGVLGQNKSFPDEGSKLFGSSQDDTRDPSVHPWGGLAATRDSMLTLVDSFLDGTSLEVLQNFSQVFDSARGRERDRELLYPDACGGGGRGWVSQGTCNSGRGHGMKESCALHTARISCEALVDFWSALGEETRWSLLRMKEEDFIERLLFRFDSKRFCRDCRRNVVREFKELKEIKRTRREPRCTYWFCAPDTAFRYEVSDSTVQADWHECISESGGLYQYFEWALGTEDGKSDILDFEDVGLCESVQADGLDLSNISACFITLRVWKYDGRYTEYSVKAHALKGQFCVHHRLFAGDGSVTITKGESIKSFFECAEEIEEEEDGDSTEEGSELDSEGSQLQKHAKSPELARDFLLDAATVIFKEQVEKAFREGTARQNAHSIFVCLALSLLEERVHVACKEITTLEKQNKLLEEEEDEKREEEERRERKRLKDKEKKLRRKEKLKGKEQKGKNTRVSKPVADTSQGFANVRIPIDEEEQVCCSDVLDIENMKDDSTLSRSSSPDMMEPRPLTDSVVSENGNHQDCDMSFSVEMEGPLSKRDEDGSFIVEHSKSARRKSKLRKGPMLDTVSKRISRRGLTETISHSQFPGQVASSGFVEDSVVGMHGLQKHSKNVFKSDHLPKTDCISNTSQWNENLHSSTARPYHKYDSQHCGCGSPRSNIKTKVGQQSLRESKVAYRHYGSMHVSKPFYQVGDPISEPDKENCGVLEGRFSGGMIAVGRGERVHSKRGWDHLQSHQHDQENCGVLKGRPPAVMIAVGRGEKVHPKRGWEQLQLHQYKASVSEKRDTSGRITTPCMLGKTFDSIDNSNKLHVTCCNGWTASDSVVSSESEKGHIISNPPHAESDARQDRVPSNSHIQEMDNKISQPATGDSLVSNSVNSRTLSVAASDDSSTSSPDANSCMLGPPSRNITKKVEGMDSVEGAFCSASDDVHQYVHQPNSDTQSESALHVCSDIGNIWGIEGVKDTCNSEKDSSPIANCSEDRDQLKGCLTGHLNGIGLAKEKSASCNVQAPQCHVPPMNIPNLAAPIFPFHSQKNVGSYQIRGVWSPLSANGVLPFSQPNRVLHSGTPGVQFLPSRLPAFSLPYPSLQPFPPVRGARHMPSLPFGSNYVQFNEFTESSGIGDLQNTKVRCFTGANSSLQGIRHPFEKQGSKRLSSSEGSSLQKTVPSNLPAQDTTGFSLFHFGGLSAVSTEEHDSSSHLPKEEIVGENPTCSNETCVISSIDHHAIPLPKERPPMEEYSLFAASHGNRFRFF
eukprot:Gb_39145 [translate_table: standard]